MINVQLYTKRTTIYESVQLYIVYVYRVYLYTQSINIQRLHETSFVSLLSFFSNENKKKSGCRGWGRVSFGEGYILSLGLYNKQASASVAESYEPARSPGAGRLRGPSFKQLER